MSALVRDLAPLVLAGVLGPAGASKLFGRGAARQAPRTALARLLRDGGRAALALRVLGAVELLLAAALLAPPLTWLPGRRPPSSARASSATSATPAPPRPAPPAAVRRGRTPPHLARLRPGRRGPRGRGRGGPGPAALVDRGGPPSGRGAVPGPGAAAAALSADPDRRWRMPLRRLRLRFTGHPLAATGARTAVPVAATVELLERSRAWQSVSRVVRSALLDHWDDGGWRILQFAGVYGGGPAARPVLVLFAVDAGASLDTVPEPAVRVSVIDADSGAPVMATA
ncbi:hypothetical protein [Streptomyces rapamycinicus]|uniref:hypothetical protein n=1 Tax=Streptomyces rapamycinicus TaxID=1226757 RepID=UPI0032D963D6